MKKILHSFIFAAIALLFIPATVSAFSISPLKYRTVVDPGKTTELEVVVKNTDARTTTFYFSVLGASTDDRGRPAFGKSIDVAESWVVPNNTNVALGPGAEKAVRYTVKVPGSAQPGSHFVGLVVEGQEAVTGGIGMRSQAAVLLALDVAGEVTEKIEIRRFESEKTWYLKTRWPLTIDLRNSGNVAASLMGTVTARNAWGHEVFREPMAAGSTFLNQSNRTITATIAPKEFLWPGVYEIQGSLTYGASQSVVSAATTIVYIPLWFCLALVLLIVLFAVFLRMRKKRMYENA